MKNKKMSLLEDEIFMRDVFREFSRFLLLREARQELESLSSSPEASQIKIDVGRQSEVSEAMLICFELFLLVHKYLLKNFHSQDLFERLHDLAAKPTRCYDFQERREVIIKLGYYSLSHFTKLLWQSEDIEFIERGAVYNDLRELALHNHGGMRCSRFDHSNRCKGIRVLSPAAVGELVSRKRSSAIKFVTDVIVECYPELTVKMGSTLPRLLKIVQSQLAAAKIDILIRFCLSLYFLTLDPILDIPGDMFVGSISTVNNLQEFLCQFFDMVYKGKTTFVDDLVEIKTAYYNSHKPGQSMLSTLATATNWLSQDTMYMLPKYFMPEELSEMRNKHVRLLKKCNFPIVKFSSNIRQPYNLEPLALEEFSDLMKDSYMSCALVIQTGAPDEKAVVFGDPQSVEEVDFGQQQFITVYCIPTLDKCSSLILRKKEIM